MTLATDYMGIETEVRKILSNYSIELLGEIEVTSSLSFVIDHFRV